MCITNRKREQDSHASVFFPHTCGRKLPRRKPDAGAFVRNACTALGEGTSGIETARLRMQGGREAPPSTARRQTPMPECFAKKRRPSDENFSFFMDTSIVM